MGRSDSRRRIAPPCLLVQCHYRALPDADGGGSPKFPSASLSTCRALKTPAQSPDASRLRVLVAGFHVGNHVALRMMLLTGLNRFRGVHPSCGLRSSLCTLTLLHSAFPFLFHSANTRYEWMASPYPAGTCTPQEAPSFAWRTEDEDERSGLMHLGRLRFAFDKA